MDSKDEEYRSMHSNLESAHLGGSMLMNDMNQDRVVSASWCFIRIPIQNNFLVEDTQTHKTLLLKRCLTQVVLNIGRFHEAYLGSLKLVMEQVSLIDLR